MRIGTHGLKAKLRLLIAIGISLSGKAFSCEVTVDEKDRPVLTFLRSLEGKFHLGHCRIEILVQTNCSAKAIVASVLIHHPETKKSAFLPWFAAQGKSTPSTAELRPGGVVLSSKRIRNQGTTVESVRFLTEKGGQLLRVSFSRNESPQAGASRPPSQAAASLNASTTLDPIVCAGLHPRLKLKNQPSN